MRRIGVLTTFYTWDKAYSLTSVVENQLIALVKYGYNPVLLVHDNFKGEEALPVGVEVRKVVPRFLLEDYSANQPLKDDFWQQVETAQKSFEENLKDLDAVFTHDIIFQGWFLPYNVAIRRVAEKIPSIHWFHWIHSAPSPRPFVDYPYDCRYTMMPNSKLIYMNHTDTLRLAEMYSGTLDDVRVVFNPLDLRSYFNFHPFVGKLIEKYKLFDADIVDVYPVSSTRFDGKQVDKVIKLLAKIKQQGRSVRFVCPNAHANAEREKETIRQMIKFGLSQGLSENEMIFTSFEGKEWEHGVPHEIVKDLFQLSNLFIFPTQSENCPLILLEAVASKCLAVLNEDFPALKDFFGKDALYFRFGSLIQRTNYENEDHWYSDVAKIIIGELNKNRPLNAFTTLKQKFNNDWIFKNMLEPILYENRPETDK